MIKKTISRTENGHVFLCPACNMIHFEYKNLNYNFNDEAEYLQFVNYFLKLDGEHWEEVNEGIYFKRKIIVPGGHPSFNMLLNNEELIELKDLFKGNDRKTERPLKASVEFFYKN